MPGAQSAIAGTFSLDPWVAMPLVAVAAVYLRGWCPLHRRAPRRFGVGRLAAFLSGLTAIAVALGSPLHDLGAVLLQAHMVQHLLLMMVAPPCLWLGAPLSPLLRGLPRRLRREWAGSCLSWPPLVCLGRVAVRPAVAWVAFAVSTWAWHTPTLFQRALASEGWHHAEHLCFLGTGLAFWWVVVPPWPGRAAEPGWTLVVYLVLADLQNTALSAWLAFADRVLYPVYAAVPRPGGISALEDQAAAGAIMWVPGSVAFLLPAALCVIRMLSPAATPPASPGRPRPEPAGPRRARAAR